MGWVKKNRVRFGSSPIWVNLRNTLPCFAIINFDILRSGLRSGWPCMTEIKFGSGSSWPECFLGQVWVDPIQVASNLDWPEPDWTWPYCQLNSWCNFLIFLLLVRKVFMSRGWLCRTSHQCIANNFADLGLLKIHAMEIRGKIVGAEVLQSSRCCHASHWFDMKGHAFNRCLSKPPGRRSDRRTVGILIASHEWHPLHNKVLSATWNDSCSLE